MNILPLHTRRLLLRVMRPGDAAVLAAYRNDEDVARYQDWPLPFTIDDAEAMLQEQSGIDDIPGEGWVQIAIDSAGATIGDVAVGVSDGGHVARLGYTLAPAFQGNGYASEAVGAIVDALFRHTAIRRLVASLDPRNAASMRLIENLGFTFEGHSRQSELIRGEWLDDMQFALLRDEHIAWANRDRSVPREVRLVEIADGEAWRWCRLQTHRFQRRFVSSVTDSFADIARPEIVDGAPVVPWFRGVEADGVPVGFVLMTEATAHHPHPFLWRLLIDRFHQRRGVATMVMRILVDDLRAAGHTQLQLDYNLGPGGPESFYRALGFVPTGVVVDGAVEAALHLDR